MSYEEINWVLVSEVYDPEEAHLIIGMLEAAGMPIKVVRESAGELFGLTVGPLARILIMAPEKNKTEAERLLEGNLEGPEKFD